MRDPFPFLARGTMPVPAWRLAVFRMAVAAVTLLLYQPHMDSLLNGILPYLFRSPVLPGLPVFSPAFFPTVRFLERAAACGLFLGVTPRASAAFLAGLGWYALFLDERCFSHNVHLHVTLLTLLVFWNDGVSFKRLLEWREETASSEGPVCPAWAEGLVRLQIAIVFFYGALDKLFSPIWGVRGLLMSDLPMTPRGWPWSGVQFQAQRFFHAFPGAMSVCVIAAEFLMSAGFLFRRLQRVALPVALGFILLLEVLLEPGVFAWDLAAALFLFFPAKDVRRIRRALVVFLLLLILRCDNFICGLP